MTTELAQNGARMTSYSRSRFTWVAYAGALCALIFAVFHVIWATGWYVGLNPETARIAFAKTPFFVYDLMVAGICAFAVSVALALAMPWGQSPPESTRWSVCVDRDGTVRASLGGQRYPGCVFDQHWAVSNRDSRSMGTVVLSRGNSV